MWTRCLRGASSISNIRPGVPSKECLGRIGRVAVRRVERACGGQVGWQAFRRGDDRSRAGDKRVIKYFQRHLPDSVVTSGYEDVLPRGRILHRGER